MKQYKQIGQIGEGTFGCVFKVLTGQGKYQAVKKIKFDEEGEEGGMPSTALRQISVLRRLKDEPYVVKLLDIENQVKCKKLALVFEYYDFDLRRYLKQSKTDLEQKQIKRILKQLLLGISSIHSKKLIHRDIKPHNILLDPNRNVKICDFGMARYITSFDKALTREVQTLWYRAPEVMLGETKYGFAVDIWSIGCIFAELYIRNPFFYGTSHEIEHLFKVFEILGTPTLDEWPEIKDLHFYNELFPRWHAHPLEKMIPKMPALGIDLLEKMLRLNPKQRISASEALHHPFFNDQN